MKLCTAFAADVRSNHISRTTLVMRLCSKWTCGTFSRRYDSRELWDSSCWPVSQKRSRVFWRDCAATRCQKKRCGDVRCLVPGDKRLANCIANRTCRREPRHHRISPIYAPIASTADSPAWHNVPVRITPATPTICCFQVEWNSCEVSSDF